MTIVCGYQAVAYRYQLYIHTAIYHNKQYYTRVPVVKWALITSKVVSLKWFTCSLFDLVNTEDDDSHDIDSLHRGGSHQGCRH